MRLIGITGKARSGKDTSAERLCYEHGFAGYAFATPIKAAMAAMFGLDERHLYGDLKETVIPWLGVTPRRLMQTLGTEWGRDIIREDIWLQVAKQQWEVFKTTDLATGLVITDVRFEDEAAWIRSEGGTIVHIHRDTAPEVEAHASEAGVSAVEGDIVVNNNGTLGQLHAQIDFIAEGSPHESFARG